MADQAAREAERRAVAEQTSAERAKALRALLRSGQPDAVARALAEELGDDKILELGGHDVEASEVDQGHITSPRWDDHKRARNWTATVSHSPGAPGGLTREFWARGSGRYVQVPDGLAPGDVVEAADDYYSGGGRRSASRTYLQVLWRSDSAILWRAAPKPGKRGPAAHEKILLKALRAWISWVRDADERDAAAAAEAARAEEEAAARERAAAEREELRRRIREEGPGEQVLGVVDAKRGRSRYYGTMSRDLFEPDGVPGRGSRAVLALYRRAGDPLPDTVRVATGELKRDGDRWRMSDDCVLLVRMGALEAELLGLDTRPLSEEDRLRAEAQAEVARLERELERVTSDLDAARARAASLAREEAHDGAE